MNLPFREPDSIDAAFAATPVKRKQWKRGPRKVSTEERFWEKVDRSGGPNACWPWQAAICAYGYGAFRIRPGRTEQASRVAWRFHNGREPDQCVCHSCDNRACCNPAHLWIGTRGDNARDKALKGRASRGEQHYYAKLTDDDVRAIRREVAEGTKLRIVGQRYGVCASSVCQIAKRRIWVHVE